MNIQDRNTPNLLNCSPFNSPAHRLDVLDEIVSLEWFSKIL